MRLAWAQGMPRLARWEVARDAFEIELSGGFTETDARVAEYVVTDQLQEAFRKALGLVGTAVRSGRIARCPLHGSFGAGKSH